MTKVNIKMLASHLPGQEDKIGKYLSTAIENLAKTVFQDEQEGAYSDRQTNEEVESGAARSKEMVKRRFEADEEL